MYNLSDGEYSIKKINGLRYLSIVYNNKQKPVFRNKFDVLKRTKDGLICACNHKNASLIRKIFSHTSPRVLGKKFAFGMGCRTNWAYSNVAMAKLAKKLNINVILAQQSAREIERTGRNFEEVIDNATWAAFEVNLTKPWGADGDHLKTKEQVKEAVLSGCTYFTYDPSDFIQNKFNNKQIEELDKVELKKAFNSLIKISGARKLLNFYKGKPFKISGLDYNFTQDEVMRIAVKYYNAINGIYGLYKFTKKLKGNVPFDAEISVDETETETTPLALIFIVSELVKRKIKFVAMAPRFIGNFEKAIDYYSYIVPKSNKKIVDLELFENKLKEINAISKYFNFKISVHSGSDKFSVYPILARITKGKIHAKTAGTSYLEELRAIALKSPELLKEIYRFSRRQFEKDRATYHLSTNLGNIPNISRLNGKQIFNLLESKKENNDLRQVLHVTYGSILTSKKFYDKCRKVLLANEKDYFAILSKHLEKHIKLLS